MEVLCEFQDVHSQHKYDFDFVDITFHITLKPDGERKKQRITKVSIHHRDWIQQILDDLEQNSIIERVGLNAAKNKELGSAFENSYQNPT